MRQIILAAFLVAYIPPAVAQPLFATPEGSKVHDDAKWLREFHELSKLYRVQATEASRAGRQGKVILRVLVGADGRVTEVVVQTSSGSPDLDKTALDSVRNAHFRPLVVNGKPQPVWVVVPINFVVK